jgi:hypothetical protein
VRHDLIMAAIFALVALGSLLTYIAARLALREAEDYWRARCLREYRLGKRRALARVVAIELAALKARPRIVTTSNIRFV